MIPYWIMFAVPALLLFWPVKFTPSLQLIGWLCIGFLFALLIGFRHEVGGDWFNYLLYYEYTQNISFLEALKLNDPAYMALNWLSAKVGGGIYLVNLFCGVVVMTGVITFARRQPLPWLSFLIAVPYLIIVVAMGYSRQSVAIGFELLALVALMERKIGRSILWIVCAVLFHKTAAVLWLFVLLVISKHRVWSYFLLILIGGGLSVLLLIEHFEVMWRIYILERMASEGGPMRVFMNALPAVMLLVFRKRLLENENFPQLWLWMSLFSVASVPLVWIASTTVDRLALYFIPIQLYVLSRIYRIFDDRLLKSVVVVSVIFGYGLVQWVWLNYAIHAPNWLPYQFYPFVNS